MSYFFRKAYVHARGRISHTKDKIHLKLKKGFTLIELLAVISIIAILSAVSAVIFTNVKKNVEDAKKKADVLAIQRAYEVKFDPTTGRYSDISGSDFTGGNIPTKPDGSAYPLVLKNLDSTGFRFCTQLGSFTGECSENSANCFCKDSSQGTYIASAPPPPPPPPPPAGPPPPPPGPPPPPPGPTKKFACDLTSFETISDGTFYGGDPNLVWLSEFNLWAMIYGRLEVPAFTVNQYSAFLSPGDTLGAPKGNWQFNSSPIVPHSPGDWDATNTETGNYVKGWTPNKLSDGLPGWEERIYFAGRNDPVTPLEVGYPIGVLYKDPAGNWQRHFNYVYYPTAWWETGVGIGEPAMYYEKGIGPAGANGTWHLYYQACTNKGIENNYPIASDPTPFECFIIHRKSMDGINWTQLVPSSTTGQPWIVALGVEEFLTGFPSTGKPEIKVDLSGVIHWVATNDRDTINYANPTDLNSGLVYKEVLFSVQDCQNDPLRTWCNHRLEAGPTFDFDPDGTMWVYFTAEECPGGGIVPANDECPTGRTQIWRLARVSCDKL